MRRLAALGLLVLTTCSTGGRTRCEKACRVEAGCAEETEAAEVDVAECVQTCRDLERQPDTRPLITQHVECIEGAKGCAAILECP